MSDDNALTFLAWASDEFRLLALAVVGQAEPFVVRGASWDDGIVLDYVIETGQTLEGGVSRDGAVELLARTYRARSRRAVDWQVPLPPVDYQDRLETRFPVYRGSSLELGPGWYDLLWATAERLEEVDPERDPFMQTKEKFGELRLYGPLTYEGEPVIEAAQLLSRHICDVCGRQGRTTEKQGWLATRCDEHRDV